MPADYSKMKNDELQNLLKERGLPHTGKKADMVARLQEADQKPSAATSEATNQASARLEASTADKTKEPDVPEPISVPKDEVKKKQEADAKPAAPTTSSEPLAESATDAAASEPNVAADADKSNKITPEEAKAKREAEEAAFSSGLAATDIDAEIAKRKKRAEKFGITLGDAEKDAIKALERAKKFGGQASTNGSADASSTSQKGVGSLDSALPEGREARVGGRKRGPEESATVASTFDDPGLVKRRRGGGVLSGRGRGGRGGGPRRGGGVSDSDRLAAEKRKARFAQASG